MSEPFNSLKNFSLPSVKDGEPERSRQVTSLVQNTVYFLPNAFAKRQPKPVALLIVDLSYTMAAQLCPQGPLRKIHPHALIDLRPHDVPIACALFGQTCDAQEVITLLNRIGYRGELTVVRPALPDPELIRAELAAQAQGFKIRLIRDHWLGGSAPHWSQSACSQSPQARSKAARIRAIPRS